MQEIGKKSRVKVRWNVSPYDYSNEGLNHIISKVAEKYGMPKDRVKVTPQFITRDTSDGSMEEANEIVSNIQEPQFQVKLFKDYLEMNMVPNYDFDLIQKIDSDVNATMDYKIYEKFKRYSVNWVKWDNFLSYGEGNSLDFNKLNGLVVVNGPNQCGKTTISVDLLHFLLFGKTDKSSTQDKIFNKHLPEAEQCTVEGCITIDGEDYVIKRTLTRASLSNRTFKSSATQRVEYYRLIGGQKETLDDVMVEELQGSCSRKTNQVIRDAIGDESDFDLIMSVTDSTLDELLRKKGADRGRLLSRWIGLLPLEEKDVRAREFFNANVKPYLLSNTYDKAKMEEEIRAFEVAIKATETENKKYISEIETLDKELVKLSSTRDNLMIAKRAVDENVLKIDITTLQRKMSDVVEEGKKKSSELESVKKELESIGEVNYSVEEFDKTMTQYTEVKSSVSVMQEKYRQKKHDIEHLKSSEVCPTCHRKLDGVDNTAAIESAEKELSKIEKEGKKLSKEASKLEKAIESMKVNRETFYKKGKLEATIPLLEAKISSLREEYKDSKRTLKEYNDNKDAIDKNNALDIELRNTDALIESKRREKDNTLILVEQNNGKIKSFKDDVQIRIDTCKKIDEEEKIIRHWKIYLDMVGKNGVSKMVLRKTLPVINARLANMLGDVCDFTVEVVISSKNEVSFNLIKDGIRSDLSSGSGFELTSAALALRSVLADISTIPRCSFITLDEVWGRVDKNNYENMKNLLKKILRSYKFILLISHIEEIKDWCNTVITVSKEDNVSHIEEIKYRDVVKVNELAFHEVESN